MRDVFGKTTEKGLDLRVGNPLFLAPCLENAEIGPTSIPEMGNETAYLKEKPDQLLEKQIKLLHKKHKNCVTTGKTLVVGNGASQILGAAMWALKQRGKTHVFAPAPYWARFKNIADMTGLKWSNVGTGKGVARVLTVPNNPDGTVATVLDGTPITGPKYDIYDCCYNWPMYFSDSETIGKKAMPINQDIVVFSFAKYCGMASTRIGWAWVKNPSIAADMAYYIESTTSGVSLEAQRHAADVIAWDLKSSKLQEFGAMELGIRWVALQCFMRELENKMEKPLYLNGNGMFAYFTGKKDVLKQIFNGVLGVSGVACGDVESETHDSLRFNIGCSMDNFNTFMKIITKNLKKMV